MEQRVSLVTLGVSDVARARMFYDRLGWRVALDVEETVFVDPDGHPGEVAYNPEMPLGADGAPTLPTDRWQAASPRACGRMLR